MILLNSIVVIFLFFYYNMNNAKFHQSLTGLRKINIPVWSLSTINADGYSTNMNIITYSNQVSIKPKINWVLSLYKKTLSHENFIRNGWGVIQLLTMSHLDIIDLLGHN